MNRGTGNLASLEAGAEVELFKNRNQMLEELIGGDQGNNAFYQKIIMDELSL